MLALIALAKAEDIYVSSNERGASILVNGVDTGMRTPATVPGVKPGQVLVSVEGACSRGEAVVNVLSGLTTRVSIVAEEQPGSLVVVPVPSTAKIELDSSPFTGALGVPYAVSCGTHTVRASADGFVTAVVSVDVGMGQTATVPISLLTLGTGSLDLSVHPRTATLYLDGKPVGTDAASLPSVYQGVHTIAAELDGYQTAKKQVVVDDGSAQAFHFELVRTGQKKKSTVSSLGGEPEEVSDREAEADPDADARAEAEAKARAKAEADAKAKAAKAKADADAEARARAEAEAAEAADAEARAEADAEAKAAAKAKADADAKAAAKAKADADAKAAAKAKADADARASAKARADAEAREAEEQAAREAEEQAAREAEEREAEAREAEAREAEEAAAERAAKAKAAREAQARAAREAEEREAEEQAARDAEEREAEERADRIAKARTEREAREDRADAPKSSVGKVAGGVSLLAAGIGSGAFSGLAYSQTTRAYDEYNSKVRNAGADVQRQRLADEYYSDTVIPRRNLFYGTAVAGGLFLAGGVIVLAVDDRLPTFAPAPGGGMLLWSGRF